MKYILFDHDVKAYHSKDFRLKDKVESEFNLNIPSMSTFQIFDPNHDYSYPDKDPDDVKIWDPVFNHKR
jgi:hypothetical protein